MYLGAAWTPGAQAVDRVQVPLEELERRGHTVVWPGSDEGGFDLDALSQCDVVHVHRCVSAEARQALQALARRGVAFTWDGGDECVPDVPLRAVPSRPPSLRGGAPDPDCGSRHPGSVHFEHAVRVARHAQAVTVPNDLVAGYFRDAGIERVEVILDALPVIGRRRRAHRGTVIGLVLDESHVGDVERQRMTEVLTALLAADPEVRVEAIGLDLRLPERYAYRASVADAELPDRLARFDIGLLPLADTPRNRTRSDILLKQYAAAGVPWLASPAASFRGLGRAHGGQLIPDDGWAEALEALVRDPVRRDILRNRGRRWARSQTIDHVVDRWESVLEQASMRQRSAPVVSGAVE